MPLLLLFMHVLLFIALWDSNTNSEALRGFIGTLVGEGGTAG